MILFLLFLLVQQDQTPRPPTKDARGLLKIDRTYFDLAANTGGDFYFWAPGEFAASRLQMPIEREPVVLAYGAIETEKTFEIPVESDVKELTVFAGIQRKDLAVLVRPDATVERDVQSFQHMLIAIVKAPAAGIWRLELHGAGTYAVTAHVNSSKPISVPSNACTFVARDGSLLADDCRVPKVPYRALIRGVDENGAAFQRIESHLRTP